MKKDICKGCMMERIGNERFCAFHQVNMQDHCPCTACLVKVMCSKLCDGRRHEKYAKLLQGGWKGEAV